MLLQSSVVDEQSHVDVLLQSSVVEEHFQIGGGQCSFVSDSHVVELLDEQWQVEHDGSQGFSHSLLLSDPRQPFWQPQEEVEESLLQDEFEGQCSVGSQLGYSVVSQLAYSVASQLGYSVVSQLAYSVGSQLAYSPWSDVQCVEEDVQEEELLESCRSQGQPLRRPCACESSVEVLSDEEVELVDSLSS